MSSKENNRAEHDSELRKLAEEIAWKKAPRSPERLSPGDTQKIIHELRVHQIELEMQNEELRRTQLELDAARERYFNLYDLAPAGYCTLDNQGLVLETNLTAATMLGVTREALTRQPVSRFILKDDQDIYYLLSKQLFKHGEPQTCELRMAKKDGTIFWVHLEATRLQDADGSFVCHAILSNITKRKHAEEALQEENRKQYRNLVEGTSDLVTRVDAVGHILFVNHAILKICGLTNAEDVQAAIDAGADFLGFVLYPMSPRFVSPAKAKELIKKVPRRIKTVGVFVDSPPNQIVELMEFCGFNIAQLHGNESAADALEIGKERVWKAMALNTEDDIKQAAAFPALAILADSIGPELRGGTGKKCDWQQAAKAAKQLKLILAGGINPENVAEAIKTVKPFAVDVCSGIEKSKGIKDHRKILELAAKLKSIKK